MMMMMTTNKYDNLWAIIEFGYMCVSSIQTTPRAPPHPNKSLDFDLFASSLVCIASFTLN